MAKRIWHGLALIALAALPAQPGGCNASHALPPATIELSTRPFAVAPVRDGCWVFVSAQGGAFKKAGIAVLKRADGSLELSRMVHSKRMRGWEWS
jgi:hypothetical protein